MNKLATCARCKIVLMVTEYCWYCDDTLCFYCWDEVGHCGHPEADAENERVKDPTAPGFELRPIPHGDPLR